MKRNRNSAISQCATLAVLLLAAQAALAQCTFSSGSTGADGDFIPTNSMPSTGWSLSNNVVTVTNSANGVFNFGSICISNAWIVNFTKNTLNTPVYLLATGNVEIAGTIDVSGGNGANGVGGVGGPGGYDGGVGGSGSVPAGNGFGPGQGLSGGRGGGGGYAIQGTDEGAGPGLAYGTIDIRPFIGGSGGAGSSWWGAEAGGAGGGALLIASSTLLNISGTLAANGGYPDDWGGGSGSGGAIRLVAPTITGGGNITAVDGGADYAGEGGYGRIRIEACTNQLMSSIFPAATYGPPRSVFLTTNPVLWVTSVAGATAPSLPAGSLTVPDVILSTNFVNPATISVAASNINPGTAFQVIITPSYGTNLMGMGTLSGTYAFSTGTVNNIAVYTDRVWRANALISYIPRP